MHRLKAGTSVIKLVDLDTAPASTAPPGGIRAATGYRYWTLSVDNIAQVLESCRAAAAPIVVAPKEVRQGVTIAIVEDPDGNWVEFLQLLA